MVYQSLHSLSLSLFTPLYTPIHPYTLLVGKGTRPYTKIQRHEGMAVCYTHYTHYTTTYMSYMSYMPYMPYTSYMPYMPYTSYIGIDCGL